VGALGTPICAAVYMVAQVYTVLVSFPMGLCPKRDCWSCAGICISFNLSILFTIIAALIYIPTNCVKRFLSSTPLPTLVVFASSHPGRSAVKPDCG
jgi:hypothetical protein